MIGKILSLGTLISTMGLLVSIVIQIYGRFFMSSAPSWTEEAARFFFIYTMSFGAGLALRDQEFVRLDLIFRKISPQAKRQLNFWIAITAIVLFVITGIWSVQYLLMGFKESSPSLQLPMAIPFGGITVMSVSIIYYAVRVAVKGETEQ